MEKKPEQKVMQEVPQKSVDKPAKDKRRGIDVNLHNDKKPA